MIAANDKGKTVTPKKVDHFVPEAEENRFSSMLQGKGTNRLTQISMRRSTPAVDGVTGLAMLTDGFLTVFVDKYNELTEGLRLSTHKLFDIFTIAITAQNGYRTQGALETTVVVSLDEYMRKCGIPLTKASKDKTRRKIKEDLDILYNTSIEWSEPSGKEMKDYMKMRIITSQGIKNGKIIVSFSPEIVRYLTNAYIMQYPEGILKISEKNTNSYYFGKKLLLHHSINNNKVKGTSNIISVRALLEATPELPAYDEISKTDRHISRRIIDPFERDMNALAAILKWEYCNARGEPLTEAQTGDFNYNAFIGCYVRFEVVGGEE